MLDIVDWLIEFKSDKIFVFLDFLNVDQNIICGETILY